MRWIRWAVLLSAFTIIVSAAPKQNLSSVALAQAPVKGIYWKQGNTVTSEGVPRVASNIQVPPNPYYEVDPGLRVPARMKYSGVGALAVRVDSHGNIWTINRGDPPISEFDSSGRYIKSLGQGKEWFAYPHFLYIDKDDNLWIANSAARPGKGNDVLKISPDGRLLLTLGQPGVVGGGPENFMGPDGVVVAPNGHIFVSDGHFVEPDGGGRAMAGKYFNWEQSTWGVTHARVAEFSPDGKFVKQWGREGSGPGQFYVPHGIAMDSQGRLFVADRGNNRIQIFNQDGEFLGQWKQFGKPCDIFIDKNDTIYVIDSDSNEDLWSWKYSTVGQGNCLWCLVRVPRLTDVGSPNPGFAQGIRIGSARTGGVTAYIPPPKGPAGPTRVPERAAVDADGNLWVADARDFRLLKFDRKVELPEGAGKQMVQSACQSCHSLRRLARADFDRAGWQTVVNTMVAGGAPLRKEDIPTVVDYLAKNFLGVATPGVTVPGSVQATIKEWDVPTSNSMPYDIISARSGVWFTEEFGNAITRFDPQTQQFQEYHLRPGTTPACLVEVPTDGLFGALFFASRTGGYIGEFHPMWGLMGYWTPGDVFIHPIPGPPGPQVLPRLRLRDIALSGLDVWFTVMEARPPLYPAGSKIGVTHMTTYVVKFANLPTELADPSGLAINFHGIAFFGERNAPKLGSVDPLTMNVTEYLLPHQGSGVSSVSITSDDNIWFTDNRRGYLGRFDPKTNEFSEWPSPSGPRSGPDAITHIGDIIWYVESGTKPNMLVRFDPKAEKFQTSPIKAGGGVKHMFAAPDGSLWFARPLSNGIGHVTLKHP